MEKKHTFKKVLSAVGNVLLWIFVLFSVVITVMVFSAQSSPDGVPSIMGKTLITVSTDSMKNEFSAGDLILVEKVSGSEVKNLQANDIILFHAPIDIDGDGLVGDLNTHRIMEKDEENSCFITKGDNNALADNKGDNPYTVSYPDVIGRYTGTKLKGVGNVLNFLRTSMGFFLCIVLPLILFFLYELYNFIAILVTEKAKKTSAQVSKDTEEEIKRRAVEEYLKQQEAEQAAAAEKDAAQKSDETCSPETASETSSRNGLPAQKCADSVSAEAEGEIDSQESQEPVQEIPVEQAADPDEK